MAIGRKPIMYPPVGPKSLAMPPEKPEKTGRPIAPSIIYPAQLTNPIFQPKTYTDMNTHKLVRDTGTGPTGRDIGPKMHVKAVMMADRHIK